VFQLLSKTVIGKKFFLLQQRLCPNNFLSNFQREDRRHVAQEQCISLSIEVLEDWGFFVISDCYSPLAIFFKKCRYHFWNRITYEKNQWIIYAVMFWSNKVAFPEEKSLLQIRMTSEGAAYKNWFRLLTLLCSDKTVDDKMALYCECCFPNSTKLWWIKLLS